MKELEQYGVTPEDIVWTLLCRGKITMQQALKFHMKEVTLEELVKEIKKNEN